jgi:hypothetical protein
MDESYRTRQLSSIEEECSS